MWGVWGWQRAVGLGRERISRCEWSGEDVEIGSLDWCIMDKWYFRVEKRETKRVLSLWHQLRNNVLWLMWLRSFYCIHNIWSKCLFRETTLHKLAFTLGLGKIANISSNLSTLVASIPLGLYVVCTDRNVDCVLSGKVSLFKCLYSDSVYNYLQ